MDALLAKYYEIKHDLEIQQKRLEKYKKKIEWEMKKDNRVSYENPTYVVKKQIQEKFCISRKDMPEQLWKEYAKPRVIQFYTIREKKHKDNLS